MGCSMCARSEQRGLPLRGDRSVNTSDGGCPGARQTTKRGGRTASMEVLTVAKHALLRTVRRLPGRPRGGWRRKHRRDERQWLARRVLGRRRSQEASHNKISGGPWRQGMRQRRYGRDSGGRGGRGGGERREQGRGWRRGGRARVEFLAGKVAERADCARAKGREGEVGGASKDVFPFGITRRVRRPHAILSKPQQHTRHARRRIPGEPG